MTGQTPTQTFTAIKASEWSIGQGVNGTGRRVKLTGAFTVDPQGRACRAFRDNEGGLAAAEKWAVYCNEHLLK